MQRPSPPPAAPPTSRVAALGPPLLLLAIAAPLLCWRIGSGSLDNADDAIFAEIARQLSRADNWLDLRLQQLPYMGKPPLFFWCYGLLFKLAEPNELAARAPVAVCGVLVCLVTYFWGWRRTGSRFAGLFAGLILLSSVVFFHFSRRVMVDVPLTLFCTLALISLERALDRRRHLIWFAVWTAAAMLTKSTAGLLPPAALFCYLCVRRQLRLLWSRELLIAVAVGALLVVPWFAIQLIQHGDAFWSGHLLQSSVHFLSKPLSERAGSPFFYVTTFFAADLLFATVAAGGLAGLVWAVARGAPAPATAAGDGGSARDVTERSPLRQRRGGDILLLCWIVTTLAVFTLARTKNIQYLLPIFPAFAVAAAGALALVGRARARVVLGSLLLLGGFAGSNLSHLSAAGAELDTDRSYKALGLAMKAHSRPDDTLHLLNIYFPAPMFYSDRRTVVWTSFPKAYRVMRAISYLDDRRVLRLVRIAEVNQLGGEKRLFLAVRVEDRQRLAPLLRRARVLFADRSHLLVTTARE